MYFWLFVLFVLAIVLLLLWNLRIKLCSNNNIPLAEATKSLKSFPASKKFDNEKVKAFVAKLTDAASKQPDTSVCTHQESAAVASNIVKENIFLCVDDLIRSQAQPLFLAHRLASTVEGGLGVRLTVQYNLFGGSVANLGSDKQLQWLRGVMSRGELGCFLLTEKKAGVLSGLIVQTTATWNKAGFVLSSAEPVDESMKVWISQGLVAHWGVVIARLILPDPNNANETIDKGPHAFIVDMHAEGVIKEDMPRKIDFNSLDNANVTFDNVQLPLDSILSKMSSVDENGTYQLVDKKVPFNFIQVAQRLLSGRTCISGAALSQLENVLHKVEDYGCTRLIPTGKNESTPLSKLPVMRDLLTETKAMHAVFSNYVDIIENEFISIPVINAGLVHRIACAKVEAVKFAIDYIHKLKEGVGSLSLFDHGPFGIQNDILYVYRFAEGDSAILQQKMARDLLKQNKAPVKLLLQLINVVKHAALNTNGIGVLKASLSASLLSLALKLNGKSREELVPCWLEHHALISTIARKLALITIYDSVYPTMKGTKELEIFKIKCLNPLL